MTKTREWEELKGMLAEDPSPLTFRAVCSVLSIWQGGDLAEALAFAAESLETWADSARSAPWHWVAAQAQGHDSPVWELARSVELCSRHLGCDEIYSKRLPADTLTRHILGLLPFSYDRTSTEVLKDAERWTSLKHIGGESQLLTALNVEDKAHGDAFFASDIIAQLEGLDVFVSSLYGKSPVIAGVTHPMPRLRRLRIDANGNHDINPLVVAQHLPDLRELYLSCDWYGGWETKHAPEHMQRLATSPIFDQLDSLTLHDFPEDAVLAICTRAGMRLKRLALHNQNYTPNLVDSQQYARRLTPSGMATLAAQPMLASLHELSIENERLGNAILHLVERTTPGQLTSLRLLDVDLDDEGAARLAQMPQLSSVISLDLSCNRHLTGRGLAALLQSPYLKQLKHLVIGAHLYNPYYGGTYNGGDGFPQSIGDAGASALAQSSVLPQLESLILRYASVGAAGVAALAQGNAPNLKELDLSQNPIGSAGIQALANSEFLRPVRDLNLSLCQLDDDAMTYLALAPLANVRNLELAYNSIGAMGAIQLARCQTLAHLWRLNLHDNFIGDEGLVALAQSPFLKRLVELDLEQDVWNYHRQRFGEQTAEIVAASSTFARLDAFYAGLVDEYHGDRYLHPFKNAGMEWLFASPKLRREMVSGLIISTASEQTNAEAAPQPVTAHPHSPFTPEQIDKQRREQDFRFSPFWERRDNEDE